MDFEKLTEMSYLAYSILLDRYTYTLPIHSGITMLSQLVCFSRMNFASCVISLLRQWGPWRALHRRHGSEIDPSSSEISVRPSRHVWAYGLLPGLIVSPNSPNEGYNPHPAAHPLPYRCHSYYYDGCQKCSSKSSSVKLLAEIVIKHWLKDYSKYTVYQAWL